MKIGEVADFYDKDYFYPNFKTYVDAFGVERRYYGPSKDWHGFDYIVEFIRSIKTREIQTVLDIGCGAGSFVARSMAQGYKTTGIDVSKYAIENCLPGARGAVRLANILSSQPTRRFDLVCGFDLMEHFLAKDVPQVINYIRQSANPGGLIFLCIATARNDTELFEHSSFDLEIPADKTWLGISGHVTIKYLDDWIRIFEEHGLKTDFELMVKFQLFRMRNAELSRVESWGTSNVYLGRV